MASIVGVASTPVGTLPDLSATDLYALAVQGAVADASRSLGCPE